MENLGIVFSGFADVRGLSFPPRFVRQWLCLTDDKLLVCRDSSQISQPAFTATISELSHLERVPLRRFCLHIYAGFKRLHLSFSHQDDLEAWSDAINKLIHPVLLIGEPQNADEVDELTDLLTPLRTDSSEPKQGGFWDDVTLASPSLRLSEGSTLAEGSPFGPLPKPPEKNCESF
ncbi:hypothetical protein SCHPADRAFT_935970 [Schizopora paradoxa]|uniref:PH domain-containing protein n=1 Tax=Schizopora paradoxa TaxID=27342 RepID=A0A0H2S3Z7_9AGAM|nr:hypothetical protein SCHPADRAFT_935970 [Schizopora paradoxa]